MKKNKLAYLFSILIFFVISCSEDKMDEIDYNNNILVEAPLQSILPQVTAKYVSQIVLSEDARQAAYISEVTARVLGRNEYDDLSTSRPSWTNAYALLRDLEILKEKAIENKGWLYAGIADFFKAATLSYLVDMFGDIPYSEAVKLDIESPNFDNATDIYDEIFIILDEAVSNIEKEGAIISPKKDDMFFGGDKILWKKTVYALKARLLNRLSNLDPKGSAQNVLAAIQNSYQNTNESMIFKRFIDATGNRNPLTAQHETAIGLGIWNAMLHFSTNKNIEDDPRYVWFTVLPDGERRPAPNGQAQADFGTGYQGRLYSKPEHQKNLAAPAPIITYNELLFLKAESYHRLGNLPEAYKAYQEAVTLSLKESMKYDPNRSISSEEINTYLSLPLVSPGVDNLSMQDIILQKIILFFNFQWVEALNEVRRTNVIPANNPLGRIHRLPYPDVELMRNVNSPKDVNINTLFLDKYKLFWAY